MLSVSRMSNTRPKIATSTQHQIPHDLRVLWEEARKSQSEEEFSSAVAIKRTMMQVRQVKKRIGFIDEVIGRISQTAFSSQETRHQLEDVVRGSGHAEPSPDCEVDLRDAI